MSQTCCADNKFSPDIIRIGQLHETARGHTLIRRRYTVTKKKYILDWCVILPNTRFLLSFDSFKKYICTNMYMILSSL